jgi:hypothetical protein
VCVHYDQDNNITKIIIRNRIVTVAPVYLDLRLKESNSIGPTRLNPARRRRIEEGEEGKEQEAEPAKIFFTSEAIS